MHRDYEIFHDESKEDGYWHSYFFVPNDKKSEVLFFLKQQKELVSKDIKELSFKDIKNKHKMSHAKPKLTRIWLSFAVAILQQQKHSSLPIHYYTSESGIYKTLDDKFGCKLVVFRVKDDHTNMYESMDQLTRLETTFRIGVKAGLHHLFSDQEKINITKCYIDGNEHYHGLYGRDIDNKRIFQRLKDETHEYVSYCKNCEIIPYQKKIEGFDSDAAILIQLTDLLLGSIRFMVIHDDKNHVKSKVSEPISHILKRNNSNPFHKRESRFSNAFFLSEAYIDANEWVYGLLDFKEKEIIETQQSLFL